MENDTNPESSQVEILQETPVKYKELHTVTPLSKYLAMALFIILPFLGGWIGYQFGADTKIVEVEKVVVQEVEMETKKSAVDENPEWKTYRNEKYGFEFQYPGSYTLQVSDVPDEGYLLSGVVRDEKEQATHIPYPLVGFGVAPKTENLEAFASRDNFFGEQVIEMKEVGGKTGLLSVCESCAIAAATINEFHIEKDVYTYSFWVSLGNDFEMLERVVETVEFFDPVLSDEQWQTYRNEEFGFELTLPVYVDDYEVEIDGGVNFFIDATNTSWERDFSAFYISAISNKEWEENQYFIDDRNCILSGIYPDQPCFGMYIGMNDTYRLTVSVGHDCPIEGMGCALRGFALDMPEGSFTTFTPAHNQAQENQTYRNEEFGFEFQYPSDWNIIFEEDFRVGISPNVKSSHHIPMIGIGFEDLDGQGYLEYWDYIDYEIDKCTDTELAGRSATRCTPTQTMAGHTNTFLDDVSGFDAFSVSDQLMTEESRQIISSIIITVE